MLVEEYVKKNLPLELSIIQESSLHRGHWSYRL